MKIIAISFEGVLFTENWEDAEVSFKPVPGAFKCIQKLVNEGNQVIITSALDPQLIQDYCERQVTADPELTLLFRARPVTDTLNEFWQVWHQDAKKVLITNRKVPVWASIEDRTIAFDGDFGLIPAKINNVQNWYL